MISNPSRWLSCAAIVGEYGRFVAGAGDGDVSEAGIDKVGMCGCIDIDQHTIGGKALRAVAGYGIAMIEVRILRIWKLTVRPSSRRVVISLSDENSLNCRQVTILRPANPYPGPRTVSDHR